MISPRVLACVALAAMLIGCASKKKPTESEEGRISILVFEQKLAADSALAGQTPTVPEAATMTAWPEPGGDADNAPGNIAAASTLKIAWRQGAGAGSSRSEHLSAPPIVADGKIFVLDAAQTVRALDAQSGHSLWSSSLRPKKGRDKTAIGGGIAFDSGKIFAASGFGEVVALNANTGAEVWRVPANAPFHAAPTASNGRIYVVTNDSELIALSETDGQTLWNYQGIAETARILAASSPAVVGDTVVAPFASGEVAALFAPNGRRLWVDALTYVDPRVGGATNNLTSLSAINDIAGRPVMAGGAIYAVSHSGVLAAIDERSGERLWARALTSTQTPCVTGDALYVVTVDGAVAAISRENGKVYWVKELRRYKKPKKAKGRIAWAGPIMVGGQLFLASSEGQGVLLSPTDGAIKQEIKLGDAVFLPPVAANGTVYVLADTGKLIALR
jgi:outer membrane protein assembly factor BamB